MADIADLVARLHICPNVVTPAGDGQMLEIAVRDLIGIPDADRLAGTNSLWIAL